MPKRRFTRAAAPATLAALPLLAQSFRALTNHIWFWGDQALIDMEARNSLTGHNLLGVYDRYGWHHLGPMWLLVLGVFRWAGAGSGSSVVFGAGLVSAAAAAGIVIMANRLSRNPTAWVAAILVVAYEWVFGAERLGTLWAPYAIAVPAALIVLLVADVASAERPWPALIGLALCATFLAQTDISTVVVVAALLVSTPLLRLAFRPPRAPHPGRLANGQAAPGAHLPSARAGAGVVGGRAPEPASGPARVAVPRTWSTESSVRKSAARLAGSREATDLAARRVRDRAGGQGGDGTLGGTTGPRANGPRANGPRANGPRANRPGANRPRAKGPGAAGAPVDWPPAVRPWTSAARRLAPWALLVGLPGLFWLPPVVQVFTSRQSNLGQVFDFMGTHPGNQPWATALRAMDTIVGSFPFHTGAESGLSDASTRWLVSAAAANHPWFVVYVLLTAAAAGVAVAHRQRVAAALAGGTLVALLAGLVSVHLVYGTLFPYLVYWMSALAVPAWLSWWLVLAPYLRVLADRWGPRLVGSRGWARSYRYAVPAACLLVTGVVTAHYQAGQLPMASRERNLGRNAWKTVAPLVAVPGARTVYIDIVGPSAMPDAAAIADAALRRGKQVEVNRSALYYLDPSFAPRRPAQLDVVVCCGTFDRVVLPRGTTLQGKVGGQGIYTSTAPDLYLEPLKEDRQGTWAFRPTGRRLPNGRGPVSFQVAAAFVGEDGAPAVPLRGPAAVPCKAFLPKP